MRATLTANAFSPPDIESAFQHPTIVYNCSQAKRLVTQYGNNRIVLARPEATAKLPASVEEWQAMNNLLDDTSSMSCGVSAGQHAFAVSAISRTLILSIKAIIVL